MNKFSEKKFETVLLYVLAKCGALPQFGKTVLYKLLYFIDFDYYELYENYLTGESYRKIDLGPAPCHFDDVVKKLIKEKKILEVKNDYFKKEQTKYIPLKEPDLSNLTAQEKEVIDDTIGKIVPMDARQVSEFSHKDIPWETTQDREVIDYELVFYRKPEYSVRSYKEKDGV